MGNQKQENFFNKMRKVFGDWYKRYTIRKPKGDSNMEAEHRRLDIGGSLERFTKQLWNETSVQRRMEQILRKRTREGKDEKVQRREKKSYQRNLRLSRFCGTKTYSDLVKVWQQWEKIAYMALRFPEQRKEGVSLDYYMGFQNGMLADIEANRKLFSDSQIVIFKEEQERKKDEELNK